MSVHLETLQRASQIVGDDDEFAAALGVSKAQMLLWMGGHEAPSMDAFLRAVDIVVKDSKVRFGVTDRTNKPDRPA